MSCKKLFAFFWLVTAANCQDVLFRSSLLPGRISHHTKTVSDGVSTVHRHQTHATSPRVALTPAIEPVFLRQSVEEPILLQHADGRFFALNANLQPGQFFRTSDGRIFTLKSNILASDRATNNEDLDVTRDANEEESTTVATTTSQPTTIATTTPAPVTEVSIEPLEEETTKSADNDESSPVAASIIATAPLTPSTARFVGAPSSSARVQQQQHFNTFHSIDHPFVHAAFPISRADIQRQRTAIAAPFLRSAVPVLRLNDIDHVDHAIVQSAPLLRTAAPATAVTSHIESSPLPRTAQQLFATFDAVPNVVATAHTHSVAAPVAVRGHQLADSNTSVFRGFYSFPNAGINFDF